MELTSSKNFQKGCQGKGREGCMNYGVSEELWRGGDIGLLSQAKERRTTTR